MYLPSAITAMDGDAKYTFNGLGLSAITFPGNNAFAPQKSELISRIATRKLF
jgi:hypothetical protein